MRVKGLTVGALATNCYILIDENTNAACIIDPGDNAARICGAVKEGGFKVEKIVLTHCHYDHFLAASALKELLGGIPVIIPEKDKVLAENPVYNLSALMGGLPETLEYDKTVGQGDKITFGSLEMKVIETPGHTPGGCCYYFENEHLLGAGDTLFFLSIGRSDFPLSDGVQLNESIKNKLFTLPDDTQVLTGHGNATSIGFEKQRNPYVY
ncbi:MAG: MBL fold metallo-hydrolase [Firmicutes bacterium]|nr:MBL fold metallo-hydrolase [Bacillota bacterium]